MKKLLIFTATILLFVGCRTAQLPPERHETTETVRIEYREILRDTTIYVQLPAEVIERVTADTLSVVQTSLARAVAQWRGNMLWHSIENIAEPFPVQIVYRDTHVIRDSVRSEYREIPFAVPAEFSRWESFFMTVGRMAFWLIVAIIGGGLIFVSIRIKRRLK